MLIEFEMLLHVSPRTRAHRVCPFPLICQESGPSHSSHPSAQRKAPHLPELRGIVPVNFPPLLTEVE